MALGYRENADAFAAKNLVVYGMNDKDAESAREWVEKEQLPFTVLLDQDRSVGIAYGMSAASAERYVANNAEGRRPAVVIDEAGLIAAWEPDMNTVEQINSLIAGL
jgi:peroxiredoxin Q/BCP